MLDSSVRSGVFSTCPEFDLFLVGKAVRPGSVFWQMVNGMHKFPNSVKPLTHLETGDMDGFWLFFVVYQHESGSFWRGTGENPSGIALALSSKRDEAYVQDWLDNMSINHRNKLTANRSI